MKLRLSRNHQSATKLLLVGGFMFFLIKGLVWLAIAAGATIALAQ